MLYEPSLSCADTRMLFALLLYGSFPSTRKSGWMRTWTASRRTAGPPSETRESLHAAFRRRRSGAGGFAAQGVRDGSVAGALDRQRLRGRGSAADWWASLPTC